MFGRKSHLRVVRQRIAEIDKVLARLKRIAPKALTRTECGKLTSEMKKRRAQLQDIADKMKNHIGEAEARMMKLNSAGAVSWSAFRTALAKSQKAFARANHKAGKAIKGAVR